MFLISIINMRHHLPVPLSIVFLLEDSTYLELEVKFLIVYLREVVKLKVNEVVRNHCVERQTKLHSVEILVDCHEELRKVLNSLLSTRLRTE